MECFRNGLPTSGIAGNRLTQCWRLIWRRVCLVQRKVMPYARRSDNTDACHSQGAQGTDREHPQAGSCQTAKDDGGKPGVRFLARSKRGTRFRTASPLGGTRQRRRRFCSPWVGRDQGRRHCRWRSPDDRNWLSFHDRYQLRGQPHPHGLNMLGLNRFQGS